MTATRKFWVKHKQWNPHFLIFFSCWRRCSTEVYWLAHIYFTYMNFLSKVFQTTVRCFKYISGQSSLQIQKHILFCGISCKIVYSSAVKGNISLMFVKESWLQTPWWHIKTNKKPIKLWNSYTIFVSTKVSNELEAGFFLIAKSLLQCFWFQMKQQIKERKDSLEGMNPFSPQGKPNQTRNNSSLKIILVRSSL